MAGGESSGLRRLPTRWPRPARKDPTSCRWWRMPGPAQRRSRSRSAAQSCRQGGGRSGGSGQGAAPVEGDKMIPALSGAPPGGVRVLIATRPVDFCRGADGSHEADLGGNTIPSDGLSSEDDNCSRQPLTVKLNPAFSGGEQQSASNACVAGTTGCGPRQGVASPLLRPPPGARCNRRSGSGVHALSPFSSMLRLGPTAQRRPKRGTPKTSRQRDMARQHGFVTEHG